MPLEAAGELMSSCLLLRWALVGGSLGSNNERDVGYLRYSQVLIMARRYREEGRGEMEQECLS